MGCNRCGHDRDDHFFRERRFERRDDFFPREPFPFDHRRRDFRRDFREFPRRRVIIIGPRRPF